MHRRKKIADSDDDDGGSYTTSNEDEVRKQAQEKQLAEEKAQLARELASLRQSIENEFSVKYDEQSESFPFLLPDSDESRRAEDLEKVIGMLNGLKEVLGDVKMELCNE